MRTLILVLAIILSPSIAQAWGIMQGSGCHGITGATTADPGSGAYAVNNILTVVDTGGSGGTVKITALSGHCVGGGCPPEIQDQSYGDCTGTCAGSWVIDSVDLQVQTAGCGYTTGTKSTTGGSGTGLTVDITVN